VINQKPPKYIPVVHLRANYASVEGFGGNNLTAKSYPFWKHIAISFNTRALKVYFGEQRVANIPNLRAEPMGLTISSQQCHPGKQALIKNIRMAKGSKKLYDEIVRMMKEHEDLNLRIEGHTDSDGEKDFNQELSEKRAASVKNLLVESGLATSRLKTKGHGESKPVADNSTPEGKANNRRVEFVKI
jgi:OmpA-OmpF porin, OOP family